MNKRYRKPAEGDLVDALCQFKENFSRHAQWSSLLEADSITRDMRKHMLYYRTRIQSNMLTTNRYGALYREDAFGNTLHQMMRDCQNTRDFKKMTFYYNQMNCWSQRYTDDGQNEQDYSLHDSFRAVFETSATMHGAEEDILYRHGNDIFFVYDGLHTKHTVEAARYLGSLPYSLNQL